MKKRPTVILAFLVLPLLILTNCDITNQYEFYVSFLSGTLSNWQGGIGDLIDIGEALNILADG